MQAHLKIQIQQIGKDNSRQSPQRVNLAIIQTMKFIDDICDKIVSPPKVRYSPYDLGSLFSAYGMRQDFHIINNRGLRLHVSFYQTHHKQRQDICVVYLHSMNGSRLESTSYVEQIQKIGYSFCSFDFSGCGNSEGKTISFGANEKYDVLAVVESLRQKFDVRKVILWGRSMGSVCAIKYCELMKDHNWLSYRRDIIGLVLDSCFVSFSRLAVEIGHKHSDFPEFMIKAGYYIIKSTIEEKGEFKIDELELQPIVANLQIPVLFLTSPDDVTVTCDHSESLFAKYSYHKKRLRYIKGLHNESRDTDYLMEVKDFINEVSREDKNALNTPFIELQANRFEKIMDQDRNFVVETDEHSKEENGCSCSLFTGAPTRSPSQERFATRSRITDRPIEKVKLTKVVPSPSTTRAQQDAPFSFRQK